MQLNWRPKCRITRKYIYLIELHKTAGLVLKSNDSEEANRKTRLDIHIQHSSLGNETQMESQQRGKKKVKNKSSTRYMKKIGLKSCKHEDRDRKN